MKSVGVFESRMTAIDSAVIVRAQGIMTVSGILPMMPHIVSKVFQGFRRSQEFFHIEIGELATGPQHQFLKTRAGWVDMP